MQPVVFPAISSDEGKLSDYEILNSRLVDRAIRPLFPDDYMNETQVIINLLSGDSETPGCICSACCLFGTHSVRYSVEWPYLRSAGCENG